MIRKTVLFTMMAVLLLAAGPALAVNELDVTNAAAQNGTTWGLAIEIDGSTNNVFVESAHPTDETHYLIRFWLDPEVLSLDENSAVRFGGIGDDNATFGQHVLLFLRRDNPGSVNQYLLNAWGRSDTGNYVFMGSLFFGFPTNPLPRQIEVEWTAASAPGANDGSLRVTRVGGPQFIVNSMDTDQINVDNIRIGALAGSGASAAAPSALYFDEFESYR